MNKKERKALYELDRYVENYTSLTISVMKLRGYIEKIKNV